MFIKNTTVSKEHQIQDILTACTENVSRFDYFLPKLKTYLRNKIKALKGGCISNINSRMGKYYIRRRNLENCCRQQNPLEPPIACLRTDGVIVAIYIIIIWGTYQDYLIGTIKTIKLFLKLGFIIQPEKSFLQPSHKITYPGFVFNSKEMLVTLTSEKREKILESCKSFFKKDSFTIRELSSLIGTLTSTFPGKNYGLLYYRKLDKCKTLGLKKNKRQFWHTH